MQLRFSFRAAAQLASFAGVFTGTCLLGQESLAQSDKVDRLWGSHCASCHGDDGEGIEGKAKTLLTRELFDQKFDRPFFETVRASTKDAHHKFEKELSDGQAWGVINHLREKQNQSLREQFGSISSKLDSQGACTTQRAKFKFQTIVDKGLDTPWGVDWLPNKVGQPLRMIITNRGGAINVFEIASGRVGEDGVLSEKVVGTPESREVGQGGMMDVAVHPDYASEGNGWIYLTFTKPIKDRATMTTLVRGRLVKTDGKWKWTDEQTLWECKPEHAIASGLHFGSRIAFGPKITEGDGAGKRHVFFTIGERGQAPHAQDIARPNGKVHRIYDDGTIPADNPFVSDSNAYASIYSYGHRNPQGLVFGTDGALWDTEHAPRGGDEFNQVLKGRNYGWPVVSFGINYSGDILKTPWPDVEGENAMKLNIMMPTARFLPSIAACGLCVMDEGPQGEAFPDWRGDFFAGGLAGETVQRLRVAKGTDGTYSLVEREEILQGMGRVRDVVCAPDGSLVVVLEGVDKIVRMVPVK